MRQNGKSTRPAAGKRRRRRTLLAAAIILAGSAAGAVLLRNALLAAFLPAFLGPALGMKITIGEIGLSMSGEAVVRGLRGEQPEEWTRFRELFIEEASARLSILRLLAGRLDGIESIRLSGAVLEMDLDRPGDPHPAGSRTPQGGGEFQWPDRLPDIDASIDRVRLESGSQGLSLEEIRLRTVHSGGVSAAEIRASVFWLLEDLDGQEDAELSFKYGSGAISDLKLSLDGAPAIEDGSIDLPAAAGSLGLRIGGGRAEIAARFPDGQRLQAEAALAGILLEDLPGLEPPPGLTAGCRIDLRIQGGLELGAPLDAEARIEASLTDIRLGPLRLEHLDGAACLAGRRLDILRLDAAGPGAAIRSAAMSLPLEDLRAESLRAGLEGELEVQAEDLSCQLVLEDPRLERLARQASLAAGLRIAGGAVEAVHLRASSPLARLEAESARLDLAGGGAATPVFSAAGDLSAGDLGAIGEIAGAAPHALGGRLSVRFLAGGELAAPFAEARLAGESLQAAGVPLGDLQGAAASSGGELRLEGLRLESAAASAPLRASISGRIDLQGSYLADLSGSLACAGLDARAAALESLAPWLPSGPARLEVRARGPLCWPDVELWASAQGIGPGPDLLAIELTAAKRGTEFTLAAGGSAGTAAFAAVEMRGSADESFSAVELEIRRLRIRSGEDRWEDGGPAILRCNFDTGAAGLEPPLFIGGGAGCFEIGLAPAAPGASAAPLAARASALIRSLPGLDPFWQPLDAALDLEALWDGETFQIGALDAHLGDLILEGGGKVRFDRNPILALREGGAPAGTAELRAAVETSNLTPIRQLFPILSRLGGSMKLSASIEGPLQAAALAADLSLDEGELRFGNAPAATALKARLALRNGAIEIVAITGELGGSPVQAAGRIDGIFDGPVLDLAINGTDVLLLRNDDARLRANAALRITGKPQNAVVAGSIDLTGGRIQQEIPLVEFIGSLTRRVRELAAKKSPPGGKIAAAVQKASSLKIFSFDQEPLKDMRMNLRIGSLAPIEVRSNIFRGQVRPDLRLLGTGEVPYLEGSLYIDSLTLILPAVRIQAESGLVNFGKKNPMLPELNLTGSASLHGYDITVSVEGAITDPAIVFSSSPPLPPDQLILLVTTGQIPADEHAGSERKAMFTVVKYLGIDLMKQILGKDDLDSRESFLERFEFDIGRNVSRSGLETMEARFRLKRQIISDADALYLTGDRDEFEHYNIGLRLVFHGS